ncbi:MerR family transcriptional regulator [Bacillus subtilis]|uniref:MerR family transcriptional regulator n=1 Tax=Bacillus subtilis TaxID=1423 RepID=UPI00207D65DF|nr:MerR family transcriptional regulator [Bacillus subtilis]
MELERMEVIDIMTEPTGNRGPYGFFSKDVAESLNITSSSLRRWAAEMEKCGYKFTRNDKDQRIYFENDIRALEELKKLLSSSHPLKSAVKTVVENEDYFKNAPTDDDNSKLSFTKDQLKQLIGQEVKAALEEEREAFLQILEEKMTNVVERRDRQLLTEINRGREQKLLETAAAIETKKKSFWRRIFPKD